MRWMNLVLRWQSACAVLSTYVAPSVANINLNLSEKRVSSVICVPGPSRLDTSYNAVPVFAGPLQKLRIK